MLPAEMSAHGANLPPGFIESLMADSLNPTSMCMDKEGRIFLQLISMRFMRSRHWVGTG